MECAQIAIDHNNTQALKVLQQCEENGNFWTVLSRTRMDETSFFRTLPWCQPNNLNLNQKSSIIQLGADCIQKNAGCLFTALFDYVKKDRDMIKQWAQRSITLGRTDIAEQLIPHTESSDCVYLLAECILRNLPSLQSLVKQMDAVDIGVACGKIAHVDSQHSTIIDVLNDKPDSWQSFSTYHNDVGNAWIMKACAQHQRSVLNHNIVCDPPPIKRTSKI